MKKKIEFSNFGFSTILLCFVMICVVTFSALSLISAYSDYKLSKKVADKNQSYYQTQEIAYNKLMELDALVQRIYQRTSNETIYYLLVEENASEYGTITNDTDGLILSFTETISTDHFLQVTLKINYPVSDSDAFIEVVEWRSYYEKDAPEDEYLDLIQ